MNRNIILTTLLGLMITLSIKTMAQYDLGFYGMRMVPQVSKLNPAFIPEYDFHFGMPALSSSYAGLGTSGPRYNQIFMVTPTDSLAIDPKGILNNVKSSNNINTRSTEEWINVGMKVNNLYFSFSVSDITGVNALYSDKLVQLGIKGNAPFVGETMSLSPIALKAMHYREFAIGAAWDLNDRLNIGLKTKLLFGKAVINTEQMNFELTTTKDYYNLDITSQFHINTSIPYDFKNSTSVSWEEYMFYKSNFGLGFDLGATYKIDDLWTVSASVIDLGYVSFDRYLKTFKSDTEFTYKGIDVLQFYGLNDDEIETKMKEVTDSLINLFEIKESEEEFYVPLTAKVYLGTDYQYNDKVRIGALVRLEIFKGTIRPSFTASYYRQMGKHFGFSASYSMINRSYLNLGLGIVANLNPLQIYIATDNIIGIIVPESARFANIHIGINFVFKEDKIRHPMINL